MGLCRVADEGAITHAAKGAGRPRTVVSTAVASDECEPRRQHNNRHPQLALAELSAPPARTADLARRRKPPDSSQDQYDGTQLHLRNGTVRKPLVNLARDS